MKKRVKADYEQLTHQVKDLILPTILAALTDIEDIIEETELASCVIRQLSGAQREASKACKSLNLALVSCQMELESTTNNLNHQK